MNASPEPWDFNRFVASYNEIARERGGWVWPGEIAADKLQGWYAGGTLWSSLREFALTRYQMDQELS